MFFYFLTIDKCKTKDEIYPTKKMYRDVLMNIYIQCGANVSDKKYPVECFEFKDKIINKIKTKVWLHYHGIMKTNLRLKYKNIKVTNYSIVWKPIDTLQGMTTYAGYINKDKIDRSQLMRLL